MLTRRPLLAALAILPLAGVSVVRAQPVMLTGDDVVMGSPDAPVTLIEYASLACSHCATFHNEVFPAFKAKHIDTGRVRFVFREMLVSDPQFAGLGAITARCAGQDKYFDVVKAIFQQQAAIYAGRELRGPLTAIAGEAGLSVEQFNACVADPAAVQAVNTRMERWMEMGVRSTPTFEVNGQRISGNKTVAELEAFMASASAA